MPAFGSRIFLDGAFEPGYAQVGDGPVELVVDDPPADAPPGLLVPPFVNAHTHLGDAALAPLDLSGTIEEVFAPPDGLKHQHLRKLSEEDAVAGMVRALETMAETGTRTFHDFREGGIDGVQKLETALDRARVDVRAGIWGRPAGMDHDAEEIDALLARCPGLGLSAVRDFEPDVVQAIVDQVRARGRKVAFHTSEAVREPIDPVLDLDPDLLVHLCEATGDDLQAVVDAGIPVACCPRSNDRFDLTPPIPALVRMGGDVYLGTDNAMFQDPDMVAEVQHALALLEDLDVVDALGMAVSDPFGRDRRDGFEDDGRVEAAVLVGFPGDDPGGALREGRAEVVRVLP